MTAHTPGPWRTGEDGDVIWGPEFRGHPVLVANVPFSKEPRVEADARLIAAAPELLEALEKAELHLAAIGTPRDAQGRYHKDGEWTFGEALPRDADAREVSAAFALVRAAIAKSKGEQP